MILQLVQEEFQLKWNFMAYHIFAMTYSKPCAISSEGSGQIEPFPLDNEVLPPPKKEDGLQKNPISSFLKYTRRLSMCSSAQVEKSAFKTVCLSLVLQF